MDRWIGKVAVVTGASSGIGADVAVKLVQAGMTVVGVARRVEKVQQLAQTVGNAKGRLHSMACDVSKEEDILRVFRQVEKEFGEVSVLINNAGVLHMEPILEGSTKQYHEIMNVNVIGMAICTREAVRLMKQRKNPGHIININSYAGHYAESIRVPINMYTASKYAVTGFTHSVRNEITAAKLNIKVTSLSPGAVDTDMLRGAIPGDLINNFAMLTDNDIADAIIYVLSTPPTVEVQELIINPLQSVANVDLEALQKSMLEKS